MFFQLMSSSTVSPPSPYLSLAFWGQIPSLEGRGPNYTYNSNFSPNAEIQTSHHFITTNILGGYLGNADQLTILRLLSSLNCSNATTVVYRTSI